MYEPSRLVDSFFIAGFQYHDGALVLDKLKVGKKLRLEAEPDNPYDPNAVAIYYKKTKLGHVPRDRNGALSTMLYFGHGDMFEPRVLQVDGQAAPWNQVRVGVYVTDARPAGSDVVYLRADEIL